jgi:hypothetical protein
MYIKKVIDHRKQFGSASLRRNQKFESFTVVKKWKKIIFFFLNAVLIYNLLFIYNSARNID